MAEVSLSAGELLAHIIPFQFLSSMQRLELVRRLEKRKFRDGDYIVRAGDRSRELFLLACGQVEIVERDHEPPRSIIEPGHYFGERAALFDSPREVSVRARGEVWLYALPAVDFLRLVDRNPIFSQAMANSLTVKQGIFLGYRRLWARIL
ncbi:MAG: cyclic nucleotide-binding domain-containing protein, partial [Myxococcota bacterium]